MGWTHETPAEAEERVVCKYPGPPAGGLHTFSNHLMNVTWSEVAEFPAVVTAKAPWYIRVINPKLSGSKNVRHWSIRT